MSSFRFPTKRTEGVTLEWARVWLAVVAEALLCTLVAATMFRSFELADLIMVYLIGVVVISTRFGRVPSVIAAGINVLAFDFFFVPPYWTLAVNDLRHAVTFGVMFAVALVMSGLTERLRTEREQAQERERTTSLLYAMSRDLAGCRRVDEVCSVAVRHVQMATGAGVRVYIQGANGSFVDPTAPEEPPSEQELSLLREAWLNTSALPSRSHASERYLAIPASHGAVGVLQTSARLQGGRLAGGGAHGGLLLETFARLIGSTLERIVLADETQRTQLAYEAERVRSGLLAAVSHDLRTPLATIEGAATTLLQKDALLPQEAHDELISSIVEESVRMSRLVRNLLDMTRLQSGEVVLRSQRESIEEVIGGALARSEKLLGNRTVTVDIAEDIPLVAMDGVLIEQLLLNLLENAVRYAPSSPSIEIAAQVAGERLVVTVADHGPGVAAGSEARIFEKFYRGSSVRGDGGAGLGLAICKAIATVHRGHISVENRAGGGALFRLELPLNVTGSAAPPIASDNPPPAR